MIEAKRRLTNIKFEHEGAHIALVSKHQGGPANGVTTLVYKALDVPEDIVQKAAEVTVTLSFHDFLRKFFGMYWEDAEVLARALGYEGAPEYDPEMSHKDYIDKKVEAISLLKNVYKAQDVSAALKALTPEETLEVLQTQELLEKAMSSAMPEGDLKSPPHNNLEDDMDKIEKALHEELLTKAVAEVETVLKAKLDEQVELVKSLQTEVENFRAEKAELVSKARKEALKAAGATDEEVEELFKAVGALADEGFSVIVKQLAAKTALADESDLFKEAGVPGAGEQDQEEIDQTAAILKAKYANTGK